MPDVTVTKLEAARSQLRVAIEFWAADRDPVAAHTLACAAYQVIHDRNFRQKGSPLLLDLAYVKPEHKRMIRAALKLPAEFMKHGDVHKRAGKLNSITFNTDLTHAFIVFAIMGLLNLKQNLTAEEQAFHIWNAIHKTELLTEAGRDHFRKNADVKTVAGLRALPKHEFFKFACETIRKGSVLARW